MEKTAFFLTDYVIQKGVIQEEERELYQYGFQRVLEAAINLFISILIAAAMHKIGEGILFFLVFVPLRSYAGGLHLEHYWSCLALSCFTYFLLLLAVPYVTISLYLTIPFILLCILLVWLLYPVEHSNRTIDHVELLVFRKRLKWYLLFDSVLMFLFAFLGKNDYLILILLTLLLVVVSMILGKIRNPTQPHILEEDSHSGTRTTS